MDLNAVVGSGATAFGVRRQPEPLAPEPRERRERERESRRVRQDAIREAKLRRMRGRSGESSEQEDGAPSQREREYMRHRFDREGYDAIHPISALQHAVLGQPPHRIWQQGDADFATWRNMTEEERDAYRDRISARRNAEARHRFWEDEGSDAHWLRGRRRAQAVMRPGVPGYEEFRRRQELARRYPSDDPADLELVRRG